MGRGFESHRGHKFKFLLVFSSQKEGIGSGFETLAAHKIQIDKSFSFCHLKQVKKILVLGTFVIGNVSILFCALILLTFYTSSHALTEAEDFSHQAVLGASTQNSLAFHPFSLPILQIIHTIIPGDSRAKLVDDFFKKYNSPMFGLGKEIVKAADKYHIPFGYLPAIGMCESQAGKVIPNDSNNAWGYGVFAGKVLRFKTWEEGIDRVSRGLRQDYFDHGLDTPEKIMPKYTPPSQGSWAFCARQFLGELQ